VVSGAIIVDSGHSSSIGAVVGIDDGVVGNGFHEPLVRGDALPRVAHPPVQRLAGAGAVARDAADGAAAVLEAPRLRAAAGGHGAHEQQAPRRERQRVRREPVAQEPVGRVRPPPQAGGHGGEAAELAGEAPGVADHVGVRHRLLRRGRVRGAELPQVGREGEAAAGLGVLPHAQPVADAEGQVAQRAHVAAARRQREQVRGRQRLPLVVVDAAAVVVDDGRGEGGVRVARPHRHQHAGPPMGLEPQAVELDLCVSIGCVQTERSRKIPDRWTWMHPSIDQYVFTSVYVMCVRCPRSRLLKTSTQDHL
jgi:hypothetical protein